MDLLIGTRNQYKVAEMMSLLDEVKDIKIHYLDEISSQIVIEEDQNSLEANARKKAVELSKHTDWYVFASDVGVDIPGLGDKWDILKNQRIVGETKTDKEKVDTLISLMSGLKGDDRRCSHHLALALAKGGNLLWSLEDTTDFGCIVEKPQNTDIPSYGWMGHVWYYPQFKKTFNQINEVKKNETRKILEKIKEELQQYLKMIG